MNRKILKLCISILFVIVSFCTVTVSATTVSVPYVKFEPKSNEVHIGGINPYGEGSRVTVLISVNDEAEPFYFRGMNSGKDGVFEFVCTVDSNEDKSGTYRVKISGAGLTPINKEFLFINSRDDIKFTEKMNNLETADAVETAISEIADDCGIDLEGPFAELSEEEGQTRVFAALSNRTYQNALDIKNAFDEAVAIQLFNESDIIDSETLIESYAELLNFDISETSYFKKIETNAGKELVFNAVTGKNHSPSDTAGIATSFNKAVYTALINEFDSNSRDLLIPYIMECNELGYIQILLDEYEDLGDIEKSSVVKKVIKAKTSSPFECLEDIVSSFYVAIDEVNEESREDNRTSGGGSGGKTSGSISVSKDFITENNNINAEKENLAQVGVKDAFSDLDSVLWAKESINYMAEKNILSGVGEGKFMPNKEITREEFVKIVVEALNITDDETSIEFGDAQKDSWYYPFIKRACASGLIMGNGDGNFGVGDNITREQLCIIVYRAMQLKEIYVESDQTVIELADLNEVSDYARVAVESLYRAGIVNGIGESKFAPKQTATRAMAAKILYEVMKKGDLI